MCLSKIYVDEIKEENCVAEEAEIVEAVGNDVKVSTLFGETKSLQGYAFSLMDSSENYVLLKKKKLEHSHEHKHEDNSAATKLKTLLPHLLKHNTSHANDIEKWVGKIKDAGFKDTANELHIACDLFQKINDHFEKALKHLDN